MLDDFGNEMDSTHSRLDSVMKKLAKVSHMTSGKLISYLDFFSGSVQYAVELMFSLKFL